MIISNDLISNFKWYLICEEKASSTVEKYIRDVSEFAKWLNGDSVKTFRDKNHRL